MPKLALLLALLWFLALFVFRTAVQWRRTGSTGFKRLSGPVGSLPWFAGVCASAGLVLAPLAPLACVLGWPGGALVLSYAPLHLVGAVLVVVGTLGGLVAQLDMGDSWRIGVDEGETATLVTGGLFAWVRNPIFSFIIVSALGFFLVLPTAWSLAACGLTVLGIELQVRAVEEPILEKRHGHAYARYAARVGRFLPGIGRTRQDEV